MVTTLLHPALVKRWLTFLEFCFTVSSLSSASWHCSINLKFSSSRSEKIDSSCCGSVKYNLALVLTGPVDKCQSESCRWYRKCRATWKDESESDFANILGLSLLPRHIQYVRVFVGSPHPGLVVRCPSFELQPRGKLDFASLSRPSESSLQNWVDPLHPWPFAHRPKNRWSRLTWTPLQIHHHYLTPSLRRKRIQKRLKGAKLNQLIFELVNLTFET